jgi:SAM-dependent methyltransferase
MRISGAFQESCILFAALDAGVFAKLAELQQADAVTLAAALKLDDRGARLLLNACVAVGLLQKTGELFSNTREAGAFLVPGSPADLSGALRYNRDVYPAWGRLLDLTRTGKPVESPDLHLGDDPERTRTFVLSMHHRALGIGRAVIPRVDLRGRSTLLDVGGGPGTYSALLAQQYPGLHCTVIDLPPVAAIAAELVQAQNLSDRVTMRPGNYRTDPFPHGNDAVIFFGVLHQESPAMIARLMKKAFDALRSGGVVYVLDLMTDASHANPPFSALFAVNMALTTENGWVFSDGELHRWMEEAGFVDFSVAPVPPPMPHWLAQARKP